MATGQNKEHGPSKVIGSISKFAGVLVGTAVATSKQIVKGMGEQSRAAPDAFGEKTAKVRRKREKKTVRKRVAKAKKKAPPDSAGKDAPSAMKVAKSGGKKKRVTSVKKKRTGRRTKGSAKAEGFKNG